MKLLVVSQVFPPRTGGSGRWLWELYRRLSHKSVVIVAGDTANAAAFDLRSALSIRRMPLDFGAPGILSISGAGHYLRAIRTLRAIVTTTRPAILHCGKSLPEGLLALAVKWTTRIPYVCYVHGEELGLADTSREFRYLTRKVLHAAQMVIANSHHSKALLKAKWAVPDASVVVMHPGVDIEHFVPAPPDPAVRARFEWTGRRVILTVGALQKRKGQDMMIRALPTIRAACPDVLYAIAGEGWERPYLEQLAREQGVADVVQFLGVTSETDLLTGLQQCDLFALPNRQVGWDFEGFGIALIEAQACGRPVIAGNSGGAPETMVPGETGELLDCDEPDALAAAAIRLLNDPGGRERMGRAGRNWVVAQFAWTELAARAATQFGVSLASAVSSK